MSKSSLRIWHVGNWCADWGNEFRESAFRSSIKDFEVLNYAKFLVRALEKIPGAEVDSIPSWELYHMSSEQFDERLNWATTIIFGDVETQSLHLNPSFFKDQFSSRYVTFPDRFDILKEWIASGGHFHMNGGWFSFSGSQGYGGWGRSRWQKDTAEPRLARRVLGGRRPDRVDRLLRRAFRRCRASGGAGAGLVRDAPQSWASMRPVRHQVVKQSLKSVTERAGIRCWPSAISGRADAPPGPAVPVHTGV